MGVGVGGREQGWRIQLLYLGAAVVMKFYAIGEWGISKHRDERCALARTEAVVQFEIGPLM
ncbi:hypothetical protein D3C81_1969160 [compost metagenome]